jgi:D-amino peptidase
MEGISQIASHHECLFWHDEYWVAGREKMQRETIAAAEGLLAGGADEVVVLDFHYRSDNLVEAGLPAAAQLRPRDEWDDGRPLVEHDADAALFIGCHPRAGARGFMSHTYMPGLRLRVADELMSESHFDAWTFDAPLLGIVGNEDHQRLLGSLASTPFLVVQRSRGRGAAYPLHPTAEASEAAIREFSEHRMRAFAESAKPAIPHDSTLELSLQNGAENAALLCAAGWRQHSDTEFAFTFESWRDVIEPMTPVWDLGFAPYQPLFDGLDLTTAAALSTQDPERVHQLAEVFARWTNDETPDWYTPIEAAARWEGLPAP